MRIEKLKFDKNERNILMLNKLRNKSVCPFCGRGDYSDSFMKDVNKCDKCCRIWHVDEDTNFYVRPFKIYEFISPDYFVMCSFRSEITSKSRIWYELKDNFGITNILGIRKVRRFF